MIVSILSYMLVGFVVLLIAGLLAWLADILLRYHTGLVMIVVSCLILWTLGYSAITGIVDWPPTFKEGVK